MLLLNKQKEDTILRIELIFLFLEFFLEHSRLGDLLWIMEVFVKKMFLKLCKFHREKPVSESLFNKVAGLKTIF